MPSSDESWDEEVDREAARISSLLAGYLNDRLDPGQHAALKEWREQHTQNQQLFDKLTHDEYLGKALITFIRLDSAAALERVMRMIARHPARARAGSGKWVGRALGLAAALLLAAAGLYLLPRVQPQKKYPSESLQMPLPADVQPGHNRAFLVLANGNRIDLDSATGGLVAREGSASILKSKTGAITYQLTDRSETPAAMNRLEVPAGGQYRLFLSDGTAVWLNAATSIDFPSVFDGKERRVTVRGEAYFEVAHDASRPFFVTVVSPQDKPLGDIRVLGTHFDVNGYGDQATLQTTLLEGKVLLRAAGREMRLLPGEQGSLRGSRLVKTSGVDPEQVLAWKKGWFRFDRDTLGAILQQVARWYNVEIEYPDRIDGHFVAEIPRNVPLSRLIRMLELTRYVHIQIARPRDTGKVARLIVGR